jgi:hypothetical protein
VKRLAGCRPPGDLLVVLFLTAKFAVPIRLGLAGFVKPAFFNEGFGVILADPS